MSQVEKQRQQLYSRTPLLGGWHRYQAVQALKQDGSPEAVEALAGAVVDSLHQQTRDLALNAVRHLAFMGSVAAQQALCRLAVEHEHPQAREIVVEQGYTPDDPVQRLRFYALVGPPEPAPDPATLQAAYQRASQGVMGERDWEAALSVLSQSGRWELLWQLAQVAPAVWSAPMLRRLRQAGWTPDRADEHGRFSYLAQLAQACPEERDKLVYPRTILEGGPPGALCLALSPDGATLSSGGPQDNQIHVYRLPDGGVFKTLSGHTKPVSCLAFSPDEGYLASGSWDHTVRLWRLDGGESPLILSGHQGEVWDVAFGPDGETLLSIGHDGRLGWWRLSDGAPLKTLPIFTRKVASCMTFGPRAQVLAGAVSELLLTPRPTHYQRRLHQRLQEQTRGADLKLWRSDDGTVWQELAGHSGEVTCLAFRPDGQLLASGGQDHSVRLWPLDDEGESQTLRGHTQPVSCLAFSADGHWLASADEGGGLRLWNLAGEPGPKVLDKQVGPAQSLIAGPDIHSWISSSPTDPGLRVWELELLRLSHRPVVETTAHEIDWAHQALKHAPPKSPESRWLAFSLALVRHQHHQAEDQLLDVLAKISQGENDGTPNTRL